MNRFAAWTVACVAIVATAGAVSVASDSRPIIPQPDHIVPFSADYVRTTTTKSGTTTEVGRFFRASDNSFRRESGPSPGTIALINVRRVQDGAMYVWSLSRGVSVHPLQTPPNGWGPQSRRRSFEQVVDEKIEGFVVLKTEPRPGDIQLEVPELNFFVIYQRTCVDERAWCTEERYSNIKIGPQPPELFEPPTQ
jgi:hypothetical protein